MKSDNQHLDFLISQYVDGCLEGTNKKSVEQKMLNDPAARELYAEHRDVQDLLDDWGNRIPMIDWAAFDQKLDSRLQKEVAEKERMSLFRRRLRPVAAAAALLLAAGVGYGWHAMSYGLSAHGGEHLPESLALAPGKGVQIIDMASNTGARRQMLSVEEPAAAGLATASVAGVTVSPPQDSVALESLMETLALGLQNVPDSGVAQPNQGSVSSAPPSMILPMDERELR